MFLVDTAGLRVRDMNNKRLLNYIIIGVINETDILSARLSATKQLQQAVNGRYIQHAESQFSEIFLDTRPHCDTIPL